MFLHFVAWLITVWERMFSVDDFFDRDYESIQGMR